MTKQEALNRVEMFAALAASLDAGRTEAFAERSEAMRDAWKAGASVTEIARAAGITHVPVIRAIRKDETP